MLASNVCPKPGMGDLPDVNACDAASDRPSSGCSSVETISGDKW